MRRIEGLWETLARAGIAGQQRIDAAHAHDIYADFEPPRQVGIVVVCKTRPDDPRPMRSLAITSGQRADRRWSLRISLREPGLAPVFAALCEDVISSTEVGVDDSDLATAVARRVQHWRALLERGTGGLGDLALQGLIGELTILEVRVMAILPLREAIGSWTGPFGAPQDFCLPSGERIEVKAVRGATTSVQVNGLGQLDGGGDPLMLAVVRMQTTAANAPGAVTAPLLIGRVRETLFSEPEVQRALDQALAAIHWHEHPSHDEFAVRVLCIDAYAVDDDFPKLTATTVPAGVLDANYTVALIGGKEEWLGA